MLTDVLGAHAEPADGPQQLINGLGAYLVLEAATAARPPGTVTIWLRTSDASKLHDRLVAVGCESTGAAQPAGREIVASVRTPQGLHLGLISGG
jgi:hypothetical protein